MSHSKQTLMKISNKPTELSRKLKSISRSANPCLYSPKIIKIKIIKIKRNPQPKEWWNAQEIIICVDQATRMTKGTKQHTMRTMVVKMITGPPAMMIWTCLVSIRKRTRNNQTTMRFKMLISTINLMTTTLTSLVRNQTHPLRSHNHSHLYLSKLQ